MAEDNVDVIDTQEATPEVNEAVVKEAQSFGWVPLEDFKGNPDDWRDAEAFVNKGKEINGFLRKDLSKVQNALAQKDSELAEIRETMEEFRKYHETTAERAYKQALTDLKSQKKEAIETGDGTAVLDIEEQIESLKEAQAAIPEVKETTSKGPSTEVLEEQYYEWSKDNTWYTTNQELNAYAQIEGQKLQKEFPNLVGTPFLELVTVRVKKRFPEEFVNPARKTAMAGQSTSGDSSGSGKKESYANLPADAKASCDKFIKQGLIKPNKELGLTAREVYCSNYEWD